MVSSFFSAHLLFTLATLVILSPICEALSFLSTRKALDWAVPGGGSNVTCTDLNNHGTHFTVDIEVGTPGQKFSVVADTGSNSLIVPSCVCQERKYCAKSDRCFTGTNKSSTFGLKEGPQGLQSVFITFGSGTIEAIVAKEKVQVGHLGVHMKDGILLMVARNLNIAGKFEGILGLGLPSKLGRKKHAKHQHSNSQSAGTTAQIKDLMKKILGGIFGGDGHQNDALQTGDVIYAPAGDDVIWDAQALPLPEDEINSKEVQQELDDIGDILQISEEDAMETAHGANAPAIMAGLSKHNGHEWLRRLQHSKDAAERLAAKLKEPEEVIGPKGLLEQAGISRFSMCFNDGSSGVLNLGIPEMSDSLSSVGKFHWGLDFRGISIGDMSAPLSFCQPGNMSKGQETPCGAIPDSGTTVIMAPKDHLSTLLDSLCDQWPRCVQNYTAMVKAAAAAKDGATKMYSFDPFEIQPAAKSAIFQLLLLDCGSWMTEADGLNELPPLKFHMAGGNGKEKTLELPGWAYVLESTPGDAEENTLLRDVDSNVVFLQNLTSHSKKVCSPAFGAMDYNTAKNGPVWILGTPFFYEFHVGYDLHSSPPSISFTSTKTTPCVSCGQQTSLLESKSNAQRKYPRWVSGRLRYPDVDTNLPL